MKNQPHIIATSSARAGAIVVALAAAATLWTGVGVSMLASPPVADPTTCLPTCAENDGRFLVVAGNDPTTMAAQSITVGLRFSAGSGDANFAIFDADPDATNWDVPFADGDLLVPDPNPPKMIIEVFNDPGGVGGTGNPVARFTPGGVGDANCPLGPCEKGDWETYFPNGNNQWKGISFGQQPDAFNGAGNYYQYAFRFSAYNPAVDKGWNAFKFRADGTVLILGKQVVGFLGAMNIPNDVGTIYPNYPSLGGSTYDGAWTFRTNLPAFLNQVTLFDGDMDFGAEDCSYNDTDDPDTVGIPVFAQGTAAVAEGVAQATGIPAAAACNGVDFTNGIRTGLPADDNSGDPWRRAPGIIPNGVAYQLVAPASPKYPGGQVFLNQNVSGNKEWEQFKIQLVATADVTNGACPVGGYPEDIGKGYEASDCRTDQLPGGAWEVQLRGMDLSNLNFFFFDFDFQPPDLNKYSIGRLVWYDANKNGIQDLCAGVPCPDELGIPNVTYSVYDGPLPGGNLVRTGSTNATGEFLETLLPGAFYTVIVDAANFDPGKPLENLVSTTGGETEDGVEVGMPLCDDNGIPVGCGLPLYAEAIFGYVQEQGVGVNAPTNTTCQDYISGNIPQENAMLYSVRGGNKIGNVSPGVIFYYTKVTVGAGQSLSVAQSHTGSAPVLGLHGTQAKVYTPACANVSSSATQNAQTGLVSFSALPPGTYVVQLKWSPKSLVGAPAPNPATSYYTFVAQLNGVPQPLTVNVPSLALQKK